MQKEELINEIKRLKEEKNAVILAHNYQIGEVQDIADFAGDSLELSRKAANTDSNIIVFCGVLFMAESAKILSPDKKVLIPDISAGCNMAEMITGDDVKKLREQYPDAVFVAYINTKADVKANVDICVTSSNALNVVQSLKQKKIVFLPDKNLGAYIKKNVKDKEIILYDGYCYVHNNFEISDVNEKKELYPDYPLIAHPESPSEVLDKADVIASTSGMLKYIKENNIKKAIIGTEVGLIHQMRKIFSDGEYIPLSNQGICANMKKITLEKLYMSLKEEKYEIHLDEEIILNAKKSLFRMINNDFNF